MKFEEALPLMRDHGKIGLWHNERFKFIDGQFTRLFAQSTVEGSSISFGNQAFTEEWEIEEEADVKVWDWVFYTSSTIYVGAATIFAGGLTEMEKNDVLWSGGYPIARRVEGSERLEKASGHIKG